MIRRMSKYAPKSSNANRVSWIDTELVSESKPRANKMSDSQNTALVRTPLVSLIPLKIKSIPVMRTNILKMPEPKGLSLPPMSGARKAVKLRIQA